MPFLLLLLLLLITLHDAWPNPLGLDPDTSAFFTWAGVGVMTLAADGAGRFTLAALRRDPGGRSAIMRRFGRWKRWHALGLLGFFVVALYLFGWGAFMHQADPGIPGFRILVLAPALVGLALGWLRQYDAERLNSDMLHYPHLALFPSRWVFLGLQARHHLLFVLPPMFLLIAHETLLLLVPSESKHTFLVSLAGIALLALGLAFIPLFLRLFLGLKPLPAGPLRERLMSRAQSLRFRFSDVLLWNTRNGAANAMVTGVLPWLRYVVLTDHLVQELTEDEVEAVFGHEVGHMKHHHMFFYMIFVMVSLMLLGGVWSAGNWWLKQFGPPSWLGGLANAEIWHTLSVWLVLIAAAGYILGVFGWLSRRCERQADIFGCKTASPAAFISALEKVADLNGIPRERPGFLSWWQHSTIADRIAFIRRMETDPTLEPSFQRRLGLLKWGLALGLIVLLVYLRMTWEWDLSKLL